MSAQKKILKQKSFHTAALKCQLLEDDGQTMLFDKLKQDQGVTVGDESKHVCDEHI